jgi:hypothetical protein
VLSEEKFFSFSTIYVKKRKEKKIYSILVVVVVVHSSFSSLWSRTTQVPTAIIIIQKGERRNLWFPIKRRKKNKIKTEIHQKGASNDGASPFYFMFNIDVARYKKLWTNKGRSLFYSSLLCNYNQKTIACTHFKSYNAHRSWTFSFFTKKKSVGAIAMDGNNRFLLKKVCFWITILLASGSILCIPFYSLVGWNNRIITNRFFPFLDVRCWSFSHAQRLGGGYTYTQQNNILSTKTTDAKTALTQHKITDKSPQHFSRVRRGGGLWVVFFFSGDGWDDGWMKLLFFFFFQVLFSCIVVLDISRGWWMSRFFESSAALRPEQQQL